jgi:1-deoxy-D-xylulose-5-phosphate synthase
VVFAIDRAGVVGEDGPTHHGVYDIAYCRMIPDMRVIAPSNEAELACALHTALRLEGPVAVRYPRGTGVGAQVPDRPTMLEEGKSTVMREGSDVAVLAFGDRVAAAQAAAEQLAEEGVSVRVVDMRWIKPLDEEAIVAAAETKLVVTAENGIISGGAGEAVLQVLAKRGLSVPARVLGIDDQTVPHGKPDKLLADLGLDADGIAAAIRAGLK